VLGVDENSELIDRHAASKVDYREKRDFAQMILENLKAAGVQQAHKEDRFTITALIATFIYQHVYTSLRMSFDNPFYSLAWGSPFDSLLPDFMLAFAFFAAVIYAAILRRFERRCDAIAAEKKVINVVHKLARGQGGVKDR
jgi:hypothetical protein